MMTFPPDMHTQVINLRLPKPRQFNTGDEATCRRSVYAGWTVVPDKRDGRSVLAYLSVYLTPELVHELPPRRFRSRRTAKVWAKKQFRKKAYWILTHKTSTLVEHLPLHPDSGEPHV